jgi:hypothetical protein
MSDILLEKTGGRIDELIGFDNNYLQTEFDTREGSRSEPTVSRKWLGWVTRGPIGRSKGSAVARWNLRSVERRSMFGPVVWKILRY